MKNRIIPSLRASLLYIAWTQALIATFGSMFFSEIMNFVPCELCWYQRIFMYPIVFVLTVGILLRDRRASIYALPFGLFGLGISVYHNLLYYGVIQQGWHVCTSGVPCETRWIQWFGFAGIPFLALTAFVIVILSLLWFRAQQDTNDIEAVSGITVAVWTRRGTSVALIVLYIFLFIVAISNGNRVETETYSTSSTFSESVSADDSTNLKLIEEGQQLYSQSCATCHGSGGQGVLTLGPSLIDNIFVAESDDTTLHAFIKTGRSVDDPLNQTGIPMPGKGGSLNLTDEDITKIIVFMRS